MSYQAASPSPAYKAIVSHLRDTMKLPPNSCFLALDPMTINYPRGGDFWVTVSPNDGTFDDALMASDIVEQCMTNTSFQVTAFCRIHLDEADNAESTLTDETRGLLVVMIKIIKALAGENIVVDGKRFLREPIRPISYGFRQIQPARMNADTEGVSFAAEDAMPIDVVFVDFQLAFDMDLG